MRHVLRRQPRSADPVVPTVVELPTPWDDGRWDVCVVGDPGRAFAAVVPIPDVDVPERPDTIVDGYLVRDVDGHPSIEVRAASVRGLAHRHYGRARQDAFTVRTTGRGRWVITAVADGVSSGPRSHLAADAAVVAVARDLAAMLDHADVGDLDWPATLRRTASAVRRAVDGDADAGATTLLVALVATSVDEHGRRAVHLLGIGDSSAWVLADGRWLRVLGGKDEDVYASSATAALPCLPTDPPHPVVVDLAPGEVLALVTDGIGDPLADGAGEVGAFLERHWAGPPAPLAFAAQVDFARRSYDDDRTAVVLWPIP